MNRTTSIQLLKTQSTTQIVIISFFAMLLAHLILITLFPNQLINLFGLLITSYFIYHFTLRKNDFFTFLMVLYFCSCLPYLGSKGGGFNMVSFVCIVTYILAKNKFPAEKRIKDKWFKLFLGLFIISCFLGWLLNYTGKGLDFVYSFITFFGVVFLLFLSSRVEINVARIMVFLQLNFIIIIYSTIASINKYFHFITFYTPMMPIYGDEDSFFEGGGIIGSSPLYGEHSLILLILFSVFYVFYNQNIKIGKATLLAGALISYINVFMSVSRSVFLLSIIGFIILLLLQYKVYNIKIHKIIQQMVFIFLLTIVMLNIIRITRLDYVFQRIEKIEEENVKMGGISIERILDGSAFNRETAFAIAKERYKSKESWLIGHGWGISINNRDAFYVDPEISRGSAHSQIFAILFLFGWLGFVAYWALILGIIYKSYRTIGNRNLDYYNRIIAYFFMISFFLFVLNEIKADSVSFPYYFAVTFIWLGLAYSNLTQKKQIFALTNTHKNLETQSSI